MLAGVCLFTSIIEPKIQSVFRSLTARRGLAADLRHAPHSGGVALRFLLKCQCHFMIERLCTQRFPEQVRNRLVIIDDAAHVKLVGPVQTSLDMAVRSQPEPVAGVAEMVADRMDQAKRPCSSDNLHVAGGPVAGWTLLFLDAPSGLLTHFGYSA